MVQEIEFDKEKAKREFLANNPDWEKKVKHTPLLISPEMIKKVIELYPDTDNQLISEMIGVTYGQLNKIITRLRAKGSTLKKIKKATFDSRFDEAFSKLSFD